MEDICNNSIGVNDAMLSLVFEKHRKETFVNWIFGEGEKCSSSKLAEAGFYFIGNKDEPDAVQCFICGKSLDGWEKNDDPWTEHKSHSPKCKFVQKMKPEMDLTLFEMVDFMHEFWKGTVRQLYSDREKMLVPRQKALRKQLMLLKKEAAGI